MLAGSESRPPNRVNTEHLNSKHHPWDQDLRLSLLFSLTTCNPMAFRGFGPVGSFLQVEHCVEAPNLCTK